MITIIKKLPSAEQESIKEILVLFNKVDAEVKRFVGLTGIHCPAGCGHCCNSLKIETTALEMLPLAAHAWEQGNADNILSRLSDTITKTCVFFQKSSEESQGGRCSIYQLRPLICRLFGFFTVKDKYGKYLYGSCKIIKKTCPESYKKALQIIKNGHHPSNMTDFAIRVLVQGSDLGRRMLPINIAVKTAIEKIGFILSFNQCPPETHKPKAA